ncbi:acyl-CoA dehydrogenase [bacterium]|nr:MAG: acyl-CoA dehydrogenase [bacterium]
MPCATRGATSRRLPSPSSTASVNRPSSPLHKRHGQTREVTFYDRPEHAELRRQVARFVEREVEPNAAAWDEAGFVPREVLRRMGALGWLGLTVPAADGGAGADRVTNVVFQEALARCTSGGFVVTVLVHTDMADPHLVQAGSDAQKRRWLPKMLSGELISAIAVTEADAGSDASALQTRAVVDDAGFALSGSKSIVSNGPHADFATVFAVVQGPEGTPAGVTAFLVDAETPGYLRARDHTCMGFTGFQGELAFDNVRLGEENVLGQVGAGFPMALAWINGNRVRTAAMTVGVARRALARSAGYAARRQQFGQPIASFQAIQLKLADMATELYAAELMVERTAAMLDQGLDIRKEGAMTKLFCSEMVNRAAYEAIQVHGGIGCLAETGIERIYRMVRIFTILEGTSEMQRVTIAGRLMRELAR